MILQGLAARIDEHFEIIRRKTGVLIATSCRLGGMLSDAADEHVETLDAFGESLGMAFQLSDDIMDLTASQLELGKEIMTRKYKAKKVSCLLPVLLQHLCPAG